MSDRHEKLARLHAKSANLNPAGTPVNLQQFADHLEIILSDHYSSTENQPLESLKADLRGYVADLRTAEGLYGNLSPIAQARAKNSHMKKIAKTCREGYEVSTFTGECVTAEVAAAHRRLDQSSIIPTVSNIAGATASASRGAISAAIQDAESLLQKLKALV